MRAYTGGSYDLFHWGHVNFLSRCAEFGDVTVALNTDDFIEEFKGKKPIMNYDEREAVLDGCHWVDRVIPNWGGADSKPAIQAVEPDFVIIGDDWKDKDYYKQMGFTEKWLDDMGIQLVYIPYTQNISATIIKQRIKDAK